MARSDFEILTMKLVKFEAVDISKLPLPSRKTKEEREQAISKAIVDITPIARPIHIAYRNSPGPEGQADNTSPATPPLMTMLGKKVPPSRARIRFGISC